MTLIEIANKFGIYGNLIDTEHIVIGHINQTYRVNIDGANYIMQRINKYVFKNPIELMDNIVNVTSYIKNYLIKNNMPTDRYVLSFIKAKDDKYYVIDDEGEYWRMYHYIGDASTYNIITDLKILENTGKAFGTFQNELSSYDASTLNETIPNFHNTIDRYQKLERAAKADVVKRFDNVKDLYDEYMSIKDIATKMCHMLNEGLLPLRVTHNDTKCNNVLLDNTTNEALAVIDLDTVMPGLAGFDFGDSIRTGAVYSKEDESDPSKIFMVLEKFEAFAKGFLSVTKNSLTKNEIDTLSLGAITMTAECGVRFLTDYLEGDVYFKPKYEGQNLIRAKSHILLSKDMINKLDKMNEIVNKYAK